MSNKWSSMLKEAGILFAITLVAGILLGFVQEVTAQPIAQQEERKIREACEAVFSATEELPGAAVFWEVEYEPDEETSARLAEDGVRIGKIYEALSEEGYALGLVVEAISSQGYGGDIALYLGVNSDGMLRDVSILEISETPGLGMRAEEVLKPQFHDRNVPYFVYVKEGEGSGADNEIDAISGATITTKAFTTAVNDGLYVANLLMEEGGVAQ